MTIPLSRTESDVLLMDESSDLITLGLSGVKNRNPWMISQFYHAWRYLIATVDIILSLLTGIKNRYQWFNYNFNHAWSYSIATADMIINPLTGIMNRNPWLNQISTILGGTESHGWHNKTFVKLIWNECFRFGV